MQIVLFDDDVRPHLIDQLVLADDAPIGLHQYRKYFERPPAHAQGPAIEKGFAPFQRNRGLAESDHAGLCVAVRRTGRGRRVIRFVR